MTKTRPNDLCHCGSGIKYKKCHMDADKMTKKAAQENDPQKLVQKGTVSPTRVVPPTIPLPPYALTGKVSRRHHKTLVNTPAQIAGMRVACKAAARVLEKTCQAVRVGITTDELDAITHQACIEEGGYPSPLNYSGFPKSVCTSVNEVICHGIPDNRPLEDGDIVNIDVTIFLGGFHGDTNRTVFVGDVDEESRNLVAVTQECLDLAIATVKPGSRVTEIGRAIARHAKKHGYGVVRDFCGHGIGEDFHNSLCIPHYFDSRERTVLKAGMTFTIEPMITLGTYHAEIWNDNWTAVTRDRKRTAQFEHTLLVTTNGVEVLTTL